MRSITFLKVLVALLMVANCVLAQTPAFPGAEGFGRYTTGGRGGIVYYVNTLEDNREGSALNREGSLRWCLERTGKRIILFKVSGTIHLKEGLNIRNGDVTIAGQSAPGDGICIADYPVVVGSGNVIIRYMRFRMGDADEANSDGADGLEGRRVKNVIVDHCSISWSTDECISFYDNENVTIQWCIGSESLTNSYHSKGAHGYGGIWGGGGHKSSFHHNMLAHHDSRVPRLGVGPDLIDVRNNVFYNYNGQGSYGGDAITGNFVNNYFKPGPAFAKSYDQRGRILSTGKSQEEDSPVYGVWGNYFLEGNYVYEHPEATADNWTYGVYNQFHYSLGTVTEEEKLLLRADEPYETDVITTHTAEDAYEQVLLYVGASLHRDAIDARIIEEARTNTAQFIGGSPNNTNPRPGHIDSPRDLKPAGAGDDWSPWPELVQREVPVDSDRDGIPDGWLEANYPGRKATDLNEEGYTYLEVYLNSLVEEITRKQNEKGVTTSVSGKKSQINKEESLVLSYNKDRSSIFVIAPEEVEEVSLYNLSGVLVSYKGKSDYNREIELSKKTSQPTFYLVKALLKNKTALTEKIFVY